MKKKLTYIEELELIRKKNKGLIRPEDVVAYAKDENTDLHSRFEWNDDIASVKWRLHQARNIIRMVVIVEENTKESCRMYVSLNDDRNSETGGYREIYSVLFDKELRNQMIVEAKQELDIFRNKYSALEELKTVFEAIDKLNK